MLEMELKALLKNKNQVKTFLEEQSCQWSEPHFQADTIYINEQTETTVKNPVFRIRKTDDQTILTLKIQETDLNTAQELELEISDDKTMHQILQTIGFTAKVELGKKRQTTEYKGYHICLDEVKRLGDFMEIEKLAEEGADKEAVYSEMMNILEEFGIKKEDLREEKYFEMILELESRRV